MKILITGATGLVGRALGQALVQKGHQLVVVSRSAKKARLELTFPCEIIEGDLVQHKITDQRLNALDAVFHLLGESVAEGRWSENKKSLIRQSRIISTQNLVASLQAYPPKTFVSASAIGYYGDQGDQTITETTKTGDSFLAHVCQEWELESSQLKQSRSVQARFGIILSKRGGALAKMLTPFRYGLGGALADGQHWMSWIHIEDVVGILLHVLENQNISGAINVVSPNPVRNIDFSRTLTKQLKTRLGPSVPKFALQALFGEMSTILLESQKVEPQKMLQSGYHFLYADVSSALKNLCDVYQPGLGVFEVEQYLDEPIESVFNFFAEAKNLELITPDYLNFKIVNMSTPQIQQGTLIDYQLKIHGVPATWQTLIEEWVPPHQFVDTQLKGPYHYWHHTHQFEKMGSGTLIRDRVLYRLPMGLIGNLVAGRFVRKDVEGIFSYRQEVIADKFKKR